MLEGELILKLSLSIAIASVMALGLVTAGLEIRWLRRRRKLDRSARREMLRSLSPLPPNALIAILMAPVWATIYSGANALTTLQVDVTAITLLLAFLAADLSYYWEHRCAHRLKPLWQLYHAIHHSSNAYSVATAYRVSFLTHLLAPAFYLPWILLGFNPIVIVGFQLFAFHYQAWLHTEMIGSKQVLDSWLNTPANHRMHHSRASAHQDVNMGAVLMIWDRLFGTYRKPLQDVAYGIDNETTPKTILELYTKPWRQMITRQPCEFRAGEIVV